MSPPEPIESFVATVMWIPRGPAILIRSQWPTLGSVLIYKTKQARRISPWACFVRLVRQQVRSVL